MVLRYDEGGVATYDSPFAYYDLPEVSAATRKVMKIVLNMNGLGGSDLVTKCQSIHDQMTGNGNFTTPSPTLVSFQSAITAAQGALVDASQAIEAARQATAAKRAAVEALMNIARLLAAYVENASSGDEAKILSSGFSIRSAPQSPESGSDTAVSVLSLTATNNEGELGLKLEPFAGRKYYEIFTTLTPADAASWVMRTTSTRASVSLTGLPSGEKVYVKVRAKLSNGYTGFSPEIGRTVP
jgi:hypothetical protein